MSHLKLMLHPLKLMFHSHPFDQLFRISLYSPSPFIQNHLLKEMLKGLKKTVQSEKIEPEVEI